MPPYLGNYTRSGDPEAMFSEKKRHLALLHQAGKAAVDADFNDGSFALIHQLRRIIETAIGEGSPNNGFQIVESGGVTSNNFTIKGGGGTDDTAGRFFGAGFPAMLVDDIEYTAAFAADMELVMPQVTGVTALTLTDSAASWTLNEHAGRVLTPNIENSGTTFAVVSNTATVLTIGAGDMTVATTTLKHYRIELSTPSGGARVDEVYLDMFLDEEDENEDTGFIHTDLSPSQAGANRVALRQYVRVTEGLPAPANFVDLDGRQHYIFLLATLNRPDTIAQVLTAHITDERRGVSSGASPATQEYLEVANYNRITDPGITTTLEYPSFAGDFETWNKMASTVAAGRVDIGFQGRLKTGQTRIASIEIPLKGTGEYQIKVFVEGQAAVNQYIPSALTGAPGARTVITVANADLTNQPTGEGIYHVVVEATIDNTENLYVARPAVFAE